MPGYILLEKRFLQPQKSDGFPPNEVRMGFLDYLRALREEPFHFLRGYRIMIEGVEEVLIAAAGNRNDVSSYIHSILVSQANELNSRMGGHVQVVFKWKLNQADDFWFEVGQERYSLRNIFGSPKKQVDRAGNEYYPVGFNLT